MPEQPALIAAIVRDQLELVQALRARAVELNISREVIDELAGLTKGYTAKLLSTPPMKRVGAMSLFLVAGALGYAVALVPDERRAHMARRHVTRYKRRPFDQDWRNSKALGILHELAVANGKLGAIARMQKTTPEQRSRISRQNIMKRWGRSKGAEIPDQPPGQGGQPAA